MDSQQGAEKKFYKRWWFWAGVIVLGFIAIGSSGSSAPSATTEQPATHTNAVQQGQNGYLHINGGGDVPVMRTQDAFSEYTKAAVNNDTMGMAQLIYADEGFLAPDGTKVLVIDSSVGGRKVRVLEGKFIGQSGWVPMEFVVSDLPKTK